MCQEKKKHNKKTAKTNRLHLVAKILDLHPQFKDERNQSSEYSRSFYNTLIKILLSETHNNQ